MNNPYVRYALALLIVLAVAEFAPQVVNVVLALVLVGMLLMNAKAVGSLVSVIGTLGR